MPNYVIPPPIVTTILGDGYEAFNPSTPGIVGKGNSPDQAIMDLNDRIKGVLDAVMRANYELDKIQSEDAIRNLREGDYRNDELDDGS